MALYRDPIIAKLISVLSASGPSFLKNRYFSGDPLQVPKSQLPAVFITKDNTTIAPATNAEDASVMPLVANVVLDLTRDWNQAFDRVNSSDMLYEAVEARNANYTLKSTSLAYLLRKNVQLDTNLWISADSELTIDYGVGIEKRGPGIFTVEAVLRFTVTHHQIRPGLE